MFPSYQAADADRIAFREYLMREEICENLKSYRKTVKITSPAEPLESYWSKALHIIDLIYYHLTRFKLNEARVESSKDEAENKNIYSNSKNIKALCVEGKTLLMSTKGVSGY